jgi:hypothetical protein
MATLFNGERPQAFDSNGKVISGALLWFYQTGTTTPQTVYADSGATTPLSNPVVADSGGLFPAIYLANTNAYKTVLQTSLGATVRTTDPISGGSGASTAFTPQGRLTLASGTPVMTANQASATAIYYTPYNGNQIPIYDGVSAFSATTFAELSNNTTQSSVGNAGPAAVTTNKNYDLFVWSNGGTPTLTRGGAWNSDTARSSVTENDLQRINGVWTNKNAITNGPGANRGTYVGTVRSDGSSQINWVVGGVAVNGTAAVLGVWNAFNRVSARGFVGDSTSAWSYSTGTVRPANNSTTMRVSFVQGLQEDFFWAQYKIVEGTTSAANGAGAGVGLNSTTAFSGSPGAVGLNNNNGEVSGSHAAQVLGFNYLQALEVGGTGTQSWTSTGLLTGQQEGLIYQGMF